MGNCKSSLSGSRALDMNPPPPFHAKDSVNKRATKQNCLVTSIPCFWIVMTPLSSVTGRGQVNKWNPLLRASLLFVWLSTHSHPIANSTQLHSGLGTITTQPPPAPSIPIPCSATIVCACSAPLMAESHIIDLLYYYYCYFFPCQLLPHHSIHPNSITKVITLSSLQSFKKCFSKKYMKGIGSMVLI